jgi:NAD(P)-dependent dehydrogenase (short-subunit alcohol dehydrogenase family)
MTTMRKVLVIGAAGGVGQQVTRQLLEQGWAVTATVLDRAEEQALRAAAPGVRDTLTLDLSNADGVLSTLSARIKELDAVAVCAAMGPVGPLETTPLALLRRTFEVNAIADVAIYQACMPMLRASEGRFAFVSSFSGKVSLPFVGAYSGSKFALEGLGDVMRREAAAFGVKVILIEPGGINTPMVAGQVESAIRDRDALSDRFKPLYGSLYDTYIKVLKSALTGGMPASQVASVVVEALTVEDPQTRYIVGEDAKFMCTQVAAMPDKQADQTLTGFLASLQ